MKKYNLLMTAEMRNLFATLFEMALKAHGGQIVEPYRIAMHHLMTAPEIAIEAKPEEPKAAPAQKANRKQRRKGEVIKFVQPDKAS